MGVPIDANGLVRLRAKLAELGLGVRRREDEDAALQAARERDADEIGRRADERAVSRGLDTAGPGEDPAEAP